MNKGEVLAIAGKPAVWKDRNSAGANASELKDGINAKKQKPAISIFLGLGRGI